MSLKITTLPDVKRSLESNIKAMQIISTSFIPAFPCKTLSFHITLGTLRFQKKQVPVDCSSRIFKDENKYEEWNRYVQHSEGKGGRRCFLLFSLASLVSFTTFSASGKVKGKNPYDEKRLLEQNKRIQEANNAPEDFPKFIREGFQVKVVMSDKYVKRDSGLIYLDIQVGQGDCPKAGQQVTFHYIGYNESGRRIDSTYLQGRPAKIRVGTKALVPGFEEGIQDMRPGGKRRIIIPPELGPPVGPSTFFSSKQFEVFDVELLGVKDCQRRTIAFYSDVVCE